MKPSVLLLAALIPLAPVFGQAVKVGDVCPDFEVYDHATGAPIRLHDFAGKIVVLDFFAYWCGPCRTSSPDLEANVQQYYAALGGNPAGVPVQVFAISIDQSDPAATTAFIEAAGMDFAGEDTSRTGWNLFSTGYIPTFAIINGASGVPGKKDWEVLYWRVGYPGATAIRTVIDAMPAPPAAAPVILRQPGSGTQSILEGSPFSLTVLASGFPAPTCVWKKDGVPIAGATGSSLSLPAASAASAGVYTVSLSNALGSVTSAPVTLVVTTALVAPATKELGCGPGRYQLAVTSRSAWTASIDVAWASLSRTSGTGHENIEVVVEPNPTGRDRVAKLRVGGDLHTLTQRAASAGLRELWLVGDNAYGQLGDHRLLSRPVPLQIAAEVTEVAAGYTHSLWRKADGTLWSVGQNNVGQLGDGTYEPRSTPQQVATGVTALAAGYSHSVFLKTDGTAWTTGYNYYGQLGNGSTTSRPTPVQVATGVAAVAAGNYHTLFLKTDGTLWAAGYNYYGQLGNGSTTASVLPVQVATGVTSIAAGGYHSLFVKTDGTLWSVGYNSYGQLGDNSTTNRSAPVQVATGVGKVAAGVYYSAFIKLDGTLWAMGSNSSGQLGDGTATNRSAPVQVAAGVTRVTAGNYHSLFLKTDGSLWAMGLNSSGQVADGTISSRTSPVQVATGVAAVAAGGYHTLYARTDRTLWVAGRSDGGQLGDGSAFRRAVPIQAAAGAARVFAGGRDTYFASLDEAGWAMGDGALGKLGNGKTEAASAPSSVSGFKAVAAGGSFVLFLRADGSAWAAGSNSYGQLADGTTTTRTTPVQVATGVKAVAAGYSHSLFLKTDGSLWAAGRNSSGQLGDATTTDRSSLVLVANGVAAIAAGSYHSLFAKTDGTLWATGSNSWGQLGDGTSTQRTVPVQIADGVSAVAAGYYHSLYLRADGALWAIGANDSGQLGDGTMISRNRPVQVASGVSMVAAGDYHTLLLRTDGTLWATGRNGSGQLGDGTFVNRSVPVRVAANVVAVAAGASHSAWIANGDVRGMPQFTTVPASQTVAAGSAAEFSAAVQAPGPVTYQWLKDGVPIAGATQASYRLEAVRAADAGRYAVMATNAAGATASPAATLTVGGASGLDNLAVRSRVGVAGEELWAAFTLEGAAVQPMLLRAVGPSLTAFGITGLLTDPKLWVYDSAGRLLAENDDWAGAQPLLAAIQSRGAFPFSGPTSKDAAIALTLPAGTYLVRVAGGAGSQGIALLELYPGDAPTRLTYASTRTRSGTGTEIATLGFVAGGSSPRQLLVRTLGPALAASGQLDDPRFALHQGASVVASNLDWVSSTELLAATATTGVLPLPTGSRDAAALVSIEPGTHVLQFGAQDTGEGLALAEVAEIDSQRVAEFAPALVSQPVPVVLASVGGRAQFGVVAVGKPAPTYQWRRNEVAISGATQRVLEFASAQAADIAEYSVVASNPHGTATSLPASLVITGAMVPATITKQPESATVEVGGEATFVVEATGMLLTYQWMRNGVELPQATGARLTIANATEADAGSYRVVICNSVSCVSSDPATLTLTPGARHAVVGPGYVPGGTVTITNTIRFAGELNSLGWSVTLPAGWSYAETGGAAAPAVKPSAGETGTLSWAWVSVPASPVTFTYTLNVPAGESAVGTLSASALVRVAGASAAQTVVVKPDPLPVHRRYATHCADTNRDQRISLFELTRVIELFNTRNGTARTGCYCLQPGSEDGYAPEPARAGTATVTLNGYHAADTNRDGRLSLFELTRVIELFNTRSGTTRTGAYRVQAGTEDGFAPGP